MADLIGHPTSVPITPPLVGREREQATLRAALAAALAGRGSLALIGGEAGIGKTALAEALLAEAASQGALVLVGRCYDLSVTPPYGPWREALARAPRSAELPALPTAILSVDREGEALTSQEAIFGRVGDYLAALARQRPVVLLLDDLHWSDPASLDLLRILARSLADLPLLVLALYRADEVPEGHPLATLLPLLVREARAIRLDLRPLDEAAIGTLVAARYALGNQDHTRLAGYLAARTEGNALFLGELLRTLEGEGVVRRDSAGWVVGDLAATPVPVLLRQVIARRVARLDPETARLLAIAAVIGQEVPLPVWGTVGDVAEGALIEHAERALEARLLAETPDGAGVRFAHALIREALYAGISALRRRAWHRRAGEVLAATAGPDPDAVAYHFRQGGDARAIAWLVRAGARAQRAYASLAVAERLAAALGLMPDDGAMARERGWLRYRVVAERWPFEPQGALAELDALVPVAAAVDTYLAAYVEHCRGMVRSSLGEYRRGLVEMAAGVARFEALPPVERIDLSALDGFVAAPLVYDEVNPAGALVLHLAGAGRLAEARALGEANVAEAPRLGSASPLRRASYGDAYNGLGQVYAYLGRLAEARRAFGLSREAYRAVGELNQTVNVCANELNLVLVPYLADRTVERRQLLAETQQEAEALARAVGPRPFADLLRLWVLLLEGRWDEVRTLAALPSPWAGPLALVPALLAREQGEPDRAWQVIRERVPDGPSATPGDAQFQLTLVAQRLATALALDAGDLATAREWLEAHDRWLAWGGSVLYRAEGQIGWAAYHRAAGESPAARLAAARSVTLATDPHQPLALLAAQRLLGELATEAEDHAKAAAHLDTALALAEACAAPYERALTLLALAELRHATGDPTATATLDEARTLLTPLEARPALARADALAARLAAPPAPPAPAALPFGLTAREVEVLRLVAQGLTDAQIAERLFVSRHTVNGHTKVIYGKLGVTSRAAATRLALDHDLR